MAIPEFVGIDILKKLLTQCHFLIRPQHSPILSLKKMTIERCCCGVGGTIIARCILLHVIVLALMMSIASSATDCNSTESRLTESTKSYWSSLGCSMNVSSNASVADDDDDGDSLDIFWLLFARNS